MMVSGIMTPKGAEDFVAPGVAQGRRSRRRSRATAWRSTPRTCKQGDLDTFRADAFDLQRVQTEEALHLLAARRLGPLLGDVPHARQAAALLLALHGSRASGVSRARARTSTRSATSTSRSTRRSPATSRRCRRGRRRAPLRPRLGAAAHVLLRHELARRRRASSRCRARARPGAASARSGVDAKALVAAPAARRASAGCRGSCRAGVKAPGPAGAHLLQQDRGAHRLEPHACLLPVGAGQRALDQPAGSRARRAS